MGEIIMNERKWAEQALRSLSLGDNPTETLGILAKYYRAAGHDKKTSARLMREFLIRCDPRINADAWDDIINSRVQGAEKYRLIEIDSLPITVAELEKISEAKSVRARKVLFTLLCLAKYANAVNPRNQGWVNHDISKVFALANVTMPVRQQGEMIHDLLRGGYIQLSRIIDNTSINVSEMMNADSEIAIEITDMRNLGNQYMRYTGDPYMECMECGAVVKLRKAGQKYCKKCADMLASSHYSTRKTTQNHSIFGKCKFTHTLKTRRYPSFPRVAKFSI